MRIFKLSLVSVLVILCVHLVGATSIAPKSLPELVADADHVIVGTVTKVDMIDGDDKPVTDPEAGTGPGLNNVIRLHIRVTDVIESSSKDTPEQLVVPLWSAWHSSLGGSQEWIGQTSIFLLKGPEYNIVYPAAFNRRLEERSEIEELLKK